LKVVLVHEASSFFGFLMAKGEGGIKEKVKKKDKNNNY
jgi:hypothetical protein